MDNGEEMNNGQVEGGEAGHERYRKITLGIIEYSV